MNIDRLKLLAGIDVTLTENIYEQDQFQRLFQLAGIDVILEAAYDSMVDALVKQVPDKAQEIKNHIKNAKAIIQKQDRMVWYIKVLRAYYTGQIKSISGEYNFVTVDQFNNEFFHFYGLNINEINQLHLQNQTIGEVINLFKDLEKKYLSSDKAPVPIREGDRIIYQFPDSTQWVFTSRSFCSEEGRSGRHCGNVQGKANKKQRILSLRTQNHNVILTFILEPNGFLGEMKAKGNQKPSEKYHQQIVTLLLDPVIKGIKGAGYAPWMNFSIFDLSEQNIQNLIQRGKESFIIDQIKVDPIGFLKAAESIRNNPKYQEVAIQQLPGLEYIIKSNDWGSALQQHPDLIIHAPESLPHRNEQLIVVVANKPELLLNCPKTILNNYDLMLNIVQTNPDSIQHILPNNPSYFKLCVTAVNLKFGTMFKVDESIRNEVIKNVLSDEAKIKQILSNDVNALKYVPKNMPGYNDICLHAIKVDPSCLEHMDLSLAQDILSKFSLSDFEAMSNTSQHSFKFIPKSLPNYNEIILSMIKANPSALDIMDDNDRDKIVAALDDKSIRQAIMKFPYTMKFIDSSKLKSILSSISDNDILQMVTKYPQSALLLPTDIKDYNKLRGIAARVSAQDFVKVSKGSEQEIFDNIGTEHQEKLISQNPYLLRYLTDKHPNYFNICKGCISRDPTTIQYVSPKYAKYSDLCIEALNRNKHTHIDISGPNKEKIITKFISSLEDPGKLVSKEPEIIQWVNPSIEGYNKLALQATHSDISTLELIHDDNAKKRVISYFKQHPEKLEKKMKDNPYILKHIPLGIRTINMYKEALKRGNLEPFKQFPKTFVSEEITKLVSYAVGLKPAVLEFIDPKYMTFDLCMAAVEKKPEVIKFIPNTKFSTAQNKQLVDIASVTKPAAVKKFLGKK